jgi:hypothetical protein
VIGVATERMLEVTEWTRIAIEGMREVTKECKKKDNG